MLEKKRLTKDQAWQKIKYFTAYQERCHQEVKDKLYSFGLYGNQVEEVIAQLIEENYLNEERYAAMFTGGKFRMKQWGRVKIRHALKQKRISEYCLNKAMKAIADEDYQQALEKLARQKWSALSTEKNLFTKKVKALNYLLGKGYEMDLVRTVIEQL